MSDFLFSYLQFTLNCPINEKIYTKDIYRRYILLVYTKLSFIFKNSVKLTKLVKDHLGDFLHGARNLKPEPSHVKEVCFLCVQCMEVCKVN